ncbi:MAG: PilZ domain-containing protein [Sphingomicrobium sp.]
MNAPSTKAPEQYADRSERRPVNLHGFLALENGTTSEITVLDMSYEGCRIATTVELSAGQHVQLAVLRRGAIDANVRWAEDGQAGLVFAAEPESAPDHLPRRSKRLDLLAEVTLRRPGKQNFRVRAYDISPEGCKVELIDRPEVGEQLWIKFDGLEALQAKACWMEGARAGLEFVRPIHAAVFELLLLRLG